MKAFIGWIPLLFLGMPLSAQDYTSYTEPYRNIKISSPEPGVIQEVLVKEGQTIATGDILVRLDTRVLDQEASMVREELRLKKRRTTKLKELLATKHATEDEIERSASDLTMTEIKLKRVEAQQERLTLRSPIDGMVTELRFDVAESLPGANSHVATVVQLKPLRVQFNLQSADARSLKAGQSIPLFFPEQNQTLEGTVEFISPVTTAVVNTIRVKVILPTSNEAITVGSRCLYQPSSPARKAE